MIFRKLLPLAGVFVLSLLSPAASATIRVVTTIPDLAWIVRSIGGDAVEVESLLRGTENPHFADARPDYIVKVSRAQAVCSVGLELEIGWLPKALARSGNAAVQPGGKGFCEVGRGVSVLDKPSSTVNRSMGDVHPSGNPHFTLSPLALIEGGKVVRDTLSALDPSQSAKFDKNYAAYSQQLHELHKRLKDQLQTAWKAAGSPPAQEYHREFAYFIDAFGLKSVGSIEEKPGVPPSASRLATAANQAKNSGVKLVLASTHDPARTLERYQELAGISVLRLPTLVQTEGPFRDTPALLEHLVQECVKTLGAKPAMN